ncbi:MAG: phosphoribosylformylglycinamidine synthase subunit PurQ [Cyanobacteria bacterium P01_D01_bin.73]
MKFGVIVFPGSNCDRDVRWVTEGILQQPTRMVWHQESDLSDLDAIVVPGGFSYGDYLRCGAIAQFSPAMQATVEAAHAGKLVLGICNGFQILTEIGLLPGALTRNQNLHFVCDRVGVRVEGDRSPWVQGYKPGTVLTLPIAHGEGRYQADKDTLKSLEDNGQVLFRYVSDGRSPNWTNPNGSLNDIAGICNQKGNVVGMMPHPERATEAATGGIDGLAMFEGVLSALVAAS